MPVGCVPAARVAMSGGECLVPPPPDQTTPPPPPAPDQAPPPRPEYTLPDQTPHPPVDRQMPVKTLPSPLRYAVGNKRRWKIISLNSSRALEIFTQERNLHACQYSVKLLMKKSLK